MIRLLMLVCMVTLSVRSVHAFPMESYKNYLIVLVHGLGNDDRPRPKTYIWTDEADDGHDSNEYGNIKGYLTGDDSYAASDWNDITPLGFADHVYNYEFSRPAGLAWSKDENQPLLAKELGDRNTANPASGMKGGPNSYTDEFNGSGVYDWGIEDGNCLIEQALADWKKQYIIKHSLPDVGSIPDSEIPKKVILIAHSMGGLTSRGYIFSSFYENDVDKLISIDTPHEGSDGSQIIIECNDWFRDNGGVPGILGKRVAFWAASMTTLSLLGPPSERKRKTANYISTGMIWELVTQLIGNSFGAFKMGYDGQEPAIQFLSPHNSDMKDLKKISDLHNPEHTMPMFRVIYTGGVITPTTGSLDGNRFNRDRINKSVPFLPVITHKRFWNTETSLYEKLSMLGLSAFGLTFLGDGDVLVPIESQKGTNVAAFINGNTKRYGHSIDPPTVQGLEGSKAAFTLTTNIFASFFILDKIEGLFPNSRFYNYLMKTAITSVGLGAAPLLIAHQGDYLEVHGFAARLAHELIDDQADNGFPRLANALFEKPCVNISDIEQGQGDTTSFLDWSYIRGYQLDNEKIGTHLAIREEDASGNVLRYGVPSFTFTQGKPYRFEFTVDDLDPRVESLQKLQLVINGFEYDLLDSNEINADVEAPDDWGRCAINFRLNENPIKEGYNAITVTCVNKAGLVSQQFLTVKLFTTPCLVTLYDPGVKVGVHTNTLAPYFDVEFTFPYSGFDTLNTFDTNQVKFAVDDSVINIGSSLIMAIGTPSADTIPFIYHLQHALGFNLNEGEHTAHVFVDPIDVSTDTAAGVGKQYYWSFIIDTTSPEIRISKCDSIYKPNNDTLDNETFLIEFALTDNYSNVFDLVTVEILRSDSSLVTCVFDGDLVAAGYIAAYWNGHDSLNQEINDSICIVRVKATDQAGNTKVLDRHVVLDAIPPVIVNSPRFNTYVYSQATALQAAENGFVIDYSVNDNSSSHLHVNIRMVRIDSLGNMIDEYYDFYDLVEVDADEDDVADSQKFVIHFNENRDVFLPDGHYKYIMSVEDELGNIARSEGTQVIRVDATEMKVSYFYASKRIIKYGDEIEFRFEVDEDYDAPLNVNGLNTAKLTLRDRANNQIISEWELEDSNRIDNKYLKSWVVSSEAEGVIEAILEVHDWADNITQTTIALINKKIPPIISSPDGASTVCGRIVISGQADDPDLTNDVSVNEKYPFHHYDLSWRRVPNSDFPAWSHLGMSVPIGYQKHSSGNLAYRSYIAVGEDNILGYWDIPDTLSSGLYQIMITASDGISSVDAIREIFVEELYDSMYQVSVQIDPAVSTPACVTDSTPLVISYTLDDTSSKDDLHKYRVDAEVIDEDNNVVYKETKINVDPCRISGAPSISSGDFGIFVYIDEQDFWNIKVVQKDVPVVERLTFNIGIVGDQDLILQEQVFSASDSCRVDSSIYNPLLPEGYRSSINFNACPADTAQIAYSFNGELLKITISVQEYYNGSDTTWIGQYYRMDTSIVYVGANKVNFSDMLFLDQYHNGKNSKVYWDGTVIGDIKAKNGTYSVRVSAIEENGIAYDVDSQNGLVINTGELKIEDAATVPVDLYISPENPVLENISLQYRINKTARIQIAVENTENRAISLQLTDEIQEGKNAPYTINFNGRSGTQGDGGTSENDLLPAGDYEFIIVGDTEDGLPIQAETLAFKIKHDDVTFDDQQALLQIDGVEKTFDGERTYTVVSGTTGFYYTARGEGQYYPEEEFEYDLLGKGTQEAIIYPYERFHVKLRRYFDKVHVKAVAYVQWVKRHTWHQGLWCKHNWKVDGKILNFYDPDQTYTVKDTVFRNKSFTITRYDTVYQSDETNTWLTVEPVNEVVTTIDTIYQDKTVIPSSAYELVFNEGKELRFVQYCADYSKTSKNYTTPRDASSNFSKTSASTLPNLDDGYKVIVGIFDKDFDLGSINTRDKFLAALNGDKAIEYYEYQNSVHSSGVSWYSKPTQGLFDFGTISRANDDYKDPVGCGEGNTRIKITIPLSVKENLWNPGYGGAFGPQLLNAYNTWDPLNGNAYNNAGWIKFDGFDNDFDGLYDSLDSDEQFGYINPFNPQRLSLYHTATNVFDFKLAGEVDKVFLDPIDEHYEIINQGAPLNYYNGGDYRGFRLDIASEVKVPVQAPFGTSSNDTILKTVLNTIYSGNTATIDTSDWPVQLSNNSVRIKTGMLPRNEQGEYKLELTIGIDSTRDFFNERKEHGQPRLLTVPWPVSLETLEDSGKGSTEHFGDEMYGNGEGDYQLHPYRSYIATGDRRVNLGTFNGTLKYSEDAYEAKVVASKITSNYPTVGSNVRIDDVSLLLTADTIVTKTGMDSIDTDSSITTFRLMPTLPNREWGTDSTGVPYFDKAMYGFNDDRDFGRFDEDIKNNIDDDKDNRIDEDPSGIIKSGMLCMDRNTTNTAVKRYKNRNIIDDYVDPLNYSQLCKQSAFIFDSDSSRLIDNPEVRVRLWDDITLYYINGDTNSDLSVLNDSITVNGEDNSADQLTIRVKNFKKAPKNYIEIKGTSKYPYELYYSKANGYGRIPTDGHPVTNGILGYWDISALQGRYTIVLVTHGPQNFIATRDIQIGTFFDADSTDHQFVTSPYGRVNLQLPDGSFDSDEVLSVTPIEQVYKDVELDLIGPVIDIQPSYQFTPGKYPTVSALFYFDELQDNGWLDNNYQLYSVSDGKLRPLIGNVVLYFDSAGDTTDKDAFIAAADENSYVIISASTSTFSQFIVLDPDSTVTDELLINRASTPTETDTISVTGLVTDTTEFTLFCDDDSILVDPSDTLTPPVEYTYVRLTHPADTNEVDVDPVNTIYVAKSGLNIAPYDSMHKAANSVVAALQYFMHNDTASAEIVIIDDSSYTEKFTSDSLIGSIDDNLTIRSLGTGAQRARISDLVLSEVGHAADGRIEIIDLIVNGGIRYIDGDTICLKRVELIHGGLVTAGSVIEIHNVLVYDASDPAMYVGSGGRGCINNVTIAKCDRGIVLDQVDSIAVKNSIVAYCGTGVQRIGAGKVVSSFNNLWDNGVDYLSPANDSVFIDPSVSNYRLRPYFVDVINDDYRLASTAGYWSDSGYEFSEYTSLCIDAGDTNDPYAKEPLGAGGRLNLGAYGNTRQASRSNNWVADIVLKPGANYVFAKYLTANTVIPRIKIVKHNDLMGLYDVEVKNSTFSNVLDDSACFSAQATRQGIAYLGISNMEGTYSIVHETTIDADSIFMLSWNGISGGNSVPDGWYRYMLTAIDAIGKSSEDDSLYQGMLYLDNTPPMVSMHVGDVDSITKNGGIIDTLIEVVGNLYDVGGVSEIDLRIENALSGSNALLETTYVLSGARSEAWSITVHSHDLSGDGNYIAVVIGKDRAGNTCQSEYPFTLNHGQPQIVLGSPESDGIYSDTLSVNGYAFDLIRLDSVYLSVQNDTGICYDTLIIEGDNAQRIDWAFSLVPSILGSGDTYSIGINAYNRFGGISHLDRIVQMDSETPIITVYSPDAEGNYSGVLSVDAVIDDANLNDCYVRLCGIDAGDTACIFDTTFEVIGNSTYAINLGLSRKLFNDEGTYLVTVGASDRAGRNTIAIRSFNVSNKPPLLIVYNPVQDSGVGNNVYVNGLASDSYGLYDISILLISPTNDTIIKTIECYDVTDTLWEITFTAVELQSDGVFSVEIFATDNMGVVSSVIREILVDASSPVVDIIDPIEGGWSQDGMITGTANDDGGLSYLMLSYRLGTDELTKSIPMHREIQKDWICSVKPGDLFGDGTYIITAIASDYSGNSDSVTRSVKIDLNDPTLAAIAPHDSARVKRGFAVIGTASDANGISSVKVILNDSIQVEKVRAFDDVTANYTIHFAEILDDGWYDLYIQAADNSGNLVHDTIVIYSDNSAPSNPIGLSSSLTANNHIEVEWHSAAVHDDDLIGYNLYRLSSISDAFTRIARVSDAETVFVDDDVQQEVTYTYVATSIDEAGNESVFSNHTTCFVPSSFIENYTVSASTYNSTAIILRLEIGSLSNLNTDSIGVWYSMTDDLDVPHDPDAVRGVFTLLQEASATGFKYDAGEGAAFDTITCLKPGQNYYFALSAKPVGGEWSAFNDSCRATLATISPYGTYYVNANASNKWKRAEITSLSSGPFDFSGASSSSLTIAMNNEVQTITFFSSDFSDPANATLSEVRSVIEGDASSFVSTLDRDGKLVLLSKAWGKYAELKVISGTAQGILALPNGTVRGSTGGRGTTNSPSSSILYAYSAATDNSVIELNTGVYRETLGKLSKDMTFRAGYGQNPLIEDDGYGYHTMLAWLGRMIAYPVGAHITFDGVNFSSSLDGGIAATGYNSGMTVKNCTATGNQNGTYAFRSGAAGGEYDEFENVEIREFNNMGLYLRASDGVVRITGCRFIDNGDGGSQDAGIYVYGSANDLIKQCEFVDHPNAAIKFRNGTNITVVNCLIHDNSEGISYFSDSENTQGCNFLFNTIAANAKNGITHYGTAIADTIKGNIVYGNGVVPVYYVHAVSGTETTYAYYDSNAFVDVEQVSGGLVPVMSYNNIDTLANMILDSTSFADNPVFEDIGYDYHTTSAFKGVDASDVSESGNDFAGDQRPVGPAWDVGCYEYGAAIPTNLQLVIAGEDEEGFVGVTNDGSVALFIMADYADSVCISNDGVTWSPWIKYSENLSYFDNGDSTSDSSAYVLDLSDWNVISEYGGTNSESLKTIYIKAKNVLGMESDIASDITYYKKNHAIKNTRNGSLYYLVQNAHDHYSTIEGDTLCILDHHSYSENIELTKGICITKADTSRAVICGAAGQPCIAISGDNNTLLGIDLRSTGNDDALISVTGNDNMVQNMVFEAVPNDAVIMTGSHNTVWACTLMTSVIVSGTNNIFMNNTVNGVEISGTKGAVDIVDGTTFRIAGNTFNAIIDPVYTDDETNGLIGAINLNNARNGVIYSNLIYGCDNGITAVRYTDPSRLASDNVRIANNTIADNKKFGILHYGTTLSDHIINNIVYGNGSLAPAFVDFKTRGKYPVADYNCFGTSDPGSYALASNNVKSDPLFVDAANGDYHLKSFLGHYADTGFVKDDISSPCLDAGDPTDLNDNEPVPNGGRINLGAYGNTNEASKSLPNVAPGVVTGITGYFINDEVTLRWSNPGDDDLAGVVVKRSFEAFPGNPLAGDLVFDGFDSVVVDGSADPQANDSIFYTVFARDSLAAYSAGATYVLVTKRPSMYQPIVVDHGAEQYVFSQVIIEENTGHIIATAMKKYNDLYKVVVMDSAYNVLRETDYIYRTPWLDVDQSNGDIWIAKDSSVVQRLNGSNFNILATIDVGSDLIVALEVDELARGSYPAHRIWVLYDDFASHGTGLRCYGSNGVLYVDEYLEGNISDFEKDYYGRTLVVNKNSGEVTWGVMMYAEYAYIQDEYGTPLIEYGEYKFHGEKVTQYNGGTYGSPEPFVFDNNSVGYYDMITVNNTIYGTQFDEFSTNDRSLCYNQNDDRLYTIGVYDNVELSSYARYGSDTLIGSLPLDYKHQYNFIGQGASDRPGLQNIIQYNPATKTQFAIVNRGIAEISSGNVLYVSSNGSNTYPFNSLATGFNELAAALSYFMKNGDTTTVIYVDEGTYTEPFVTDAALPYNLEIRPVDINHTPVISDVNFSGTADEAKLWIHDVAMASELHIATNGQVKIHDLEIHVKEGETGIRITNATGSNTVRNVLLYADQHTDNTGLVVSGAAATIAENLTIYGMANAGVQAENGATLALKNSIIVNNGTGIVNAANPGAVSSSYNNVYGNGTDYSGADSGNGDISLEPLFVDPENGNFHLSSYGGHYVNVTSTDTIFGADALNSPCISAGDPTSLNYYELEPNGGRINLGAFGNTVKASRVDTVTGAKVWFVDGSAPAGGNGQTASTALRALESALVAVRPGDRIVVNNQLRVENDIVVDVPVNISFSEGTVVEFGEIDSVSSPEGLFADKVELIFAGGSRVHIKGTDSSRVVFRPLASAEWGGIRIVTDSCSIAGCELYGSRYGFSVADSNAGNRDIIFQDVYIHDIDGDAIQAYNCSGLVISDSRFARIYDNNLDLNGCPWFSIHDNTFNDGHFDLYGDNSLLEITGSNGVFEYNDIAGPFVYEQELAFVGLRVRDVPAESALVVIGNRFYNCFVAAELQNTDNALIADNSFIDNRNTGILLDNSSPFITNNTFVGGDSTGHYGSNAIWSTNSSQPGICNNIVYYWMYGIACSDGAVPAIVRNNCFFGQVGSQNILVDTAITDVNTLPFAAGNIYADPVFNNFEQLHARNSSLSAYAAAKDSIASWCGNGLTGYINALDSRIGLSVNGTGRLYGRVDASITDPAGHVLSRTVNTIGGQSYYLPYDSLDDDSRFMIDTVQQGGYVFNVTADTLFDRQYSFHFGYAGKRFEFAKSASKPDSAGAHVYGCNVESTVPANPDGIIVSSGASGNTIQWNEAGDSDIAGYLIYAANRSDFLPTLGKRLAQVSAGTNTFVDSGSVSAMPRYYRVASIDSAGNISGTDSAQADLPFEIVSAVYRNNGTQDVTDDTLRITFTRKVNDAGLVDMDWLGIEGFGGIQYAGFSTGEHINDSIVLVIPGTGDSCLAHNRSSVVVAQGAVFDIYGNGCESDTVSVITYNVSNADLDVSYRTILEALSDSAFSDGDTILVYDAGYYTDPLNFVGLNVEPVIIGQSGQRPSIKFDGIGMDDFSAWIGHDLMVYTSWGSGHPVFRNMVWDGISASGDTASRFGFMAEGEMWNCSMNHAAVYYHKKGQIIVDNCEFTGKGIARWENKSSDSRITDCRFHNISAPNSGLTGALMIYGGCNGTFERNVFTGIQGNAVYLRNANGNTFTNNLIYDVEGTAVYQYSSLAADLPTFNTYLNNTVHGCFAGMELDSMCTVRNNIVYGCRDWQVKVDARAVVDTRLIRNNLFDTTASNVTGLFDGVSNILGSTDPDFIDAANGDFRLNATSPCISATDVFADEAAAIGIDVDMDGNLRPMPYGSTVDMGCFEEQSNVMLRIVSADFHSNGTVAREDDVLEVTLSCMVDDDSLVSGVGSASAAFQLFGYGDVAGASLHTGTHTGDNIVELHGLTSSDIISHNRSYVGLNGLHIRTLPTATFADDDAVLITTYNCFNRTMDESFETMLDAIKSAGNDDTVEVLDAGIYTDTLDFNRLGVAACVTGMYVEYPSMVYNGTGMNGFSAWKGSRMMLHAASYSLRPEFNRIRFDGTAPDGSEAGRFGFIGAGVFNDCIFENASLYIASTGATVFDGCEFKGTRHHILWRSNKSGSRITGCMFDSVSAPNSYSGVVSVYGAYGTLIERNTFRKVQGNAILVRNADHNTFSNNLIYGSSAFAILQYSSISSDLPRYNRYLNNTIVDNRYGLELDSMCTVKYNIIYGNQEWNMRLDSKAMVSPDDIELNLCDTTGSGIPFDMSIQRNIVDGTEPGFIDMENGDFRLTGNSVCIAYSQAGGNVVDSLGLGTDITGLSRPMPEYSYMDLGCFEEQVVDPTIASNRVYIAHNGLNVAPYDSPYKAALSVADAFGVLETGDTAVFLQSGRYEEAHPCSITVTDIVVKTAEGVCCTLARAGQSTDSSAVIKLKANRIAVAGLAIDGNGIASCGILMRKTNAVGMAFTDLDIFGISSYGNFWTEGSAGIYFMDNYSTSVISGCKIHDFAMGNSNVFRHGIFIKDNQSLSGHHEISYCEIYNVPYAVFTKENNGRNKIHHNVVYDCYNGITSTGNNSNDTLLYNTVYGCTSTGITMYGWDTLATRRNQYRYNISWNNGLDFKALGDYDAWDFNYNCFESASEGVTVNATHIQDAPQFNDAGNGDFSLTALSPCIDATGDSTVWTDFMGRTTPYGVSNDIGAIEFPGGVAKPADNTRIGTEYVGRLVHNRPNPFVTSTEISMIIPAGERHLTLATLKIHTADGDLVRTVFSKQVPSGCTVTLEWDGKNTQGVRQGSGVYIYEFTCGDILEKGNIIITE